MNSVAAFILAAGSSSRLGQPKQLVKIKGEFVLYYIRKTVMNAGVSRITFVLGANADRIIEELNMTSKDFLINSNWKEGMSSSFLRALEEMDESINAALFLTCDQYEVSSPLIKSILNKHLKFPESIVASEFSNTILGPPVLFPRNYFDQLSNIKGDKGAKSILEMNRDSVRTVDFPKGIKDIDTQNDLKELLSL